LTAIKDELGDLSLTKIDVMRGMGSAAAFGRTIQGEVK
jgi:hypothetical protein